MLILLDRRRFALLMEGVVGSSNGLVRFKFLELLPRVFSDRFYDLGQTHQARLGLEPYLELVNLLGPKLDKTG